MTALSRTIPDGSDSVAWLDRLIAFPTVSRDPNRDLIDCVASYLSSLGARVRVFAQPTGGKANLFASIGPDGPGGVLLSGHTDVVPVEGQLWSTDPFRMAERDGLLFGRGAADMKGFLACALQAAGIAASRRLAHPLHLAMSYDEEVGCTGVRGMLDVLAEEGLRPSLCIVGEPTGMQVATGHKGKLAARAVCCGVAGHSALAPLACNAIHLASDLVQGLRRRQERLAQVGVRDEGYDIPYSTVHVGRIEGGVALNIVPESCVLDFEIRTVGGDDAPAILAQIAGEAAALTATARRRFASAGIVIESLNDYPGLDTPANSEAFALARALADAGPARKVSFGTEGGLFHQRLDIPVVICGPGDMAQGHVADEFVSRAQLAHCDRMLDALIERLLA